MAGRWLRSRVGGRALILGYHRVASVDSDPHRLAVSPIYFAEQLEVLHTQAHPVSLRRLVSGLRKGDLPRRAVAVTFDDGYADVLYAAWPLLERHEVPATVFVTTGALGREFWWDELERLIGQGEGLGTAAAPPRGLPEQLAISSGPKVGSSWYDIMRAKASEEREALMSELRKAASAPVLPSDPARSLTSDELLRLAGGGLIEVGAHTITHPVLADLPENRQRGEVAGSKSYLEDLLGRPLAGFSYPNGSLSEDTVEVVRDSGFDYACCSYQDAVRRATDPFKLPRFWIPDWDGSTFSRWLNRWL